MPREWFPLRTWWWILLKGQIPKICWCRLPHCSHPRRHCCQLWPNCWLQWRKWLSHQQYGCHAKVLERRHQKDTHPQERTIYSLHTTTICSPTIQHPRSLRWCFWSQDWSHLRHDGCLPWKRWRKEDHRKARCHLSNRHPSQKGSTPRKVMDSWLEERKRKGQPRKGTNWCHFHHDRRRLCSSLYGQAQSPNCLHDR